MKIVKYSTLSNNALDKREKVMLAMTEVDENFVIGRRNYDAKRIDGKKEQLKRMKEKEYALHY
ncbi:hypothetical protein [Macrococcus sp. DPC7161]|uniref:hypothetical protein n=1 Tax=Macrococcus sp. DPC7161 TaxID=2507060 RepID=UPI00100AAAD6|nr:hypothetical protein [Macrococcus sp. DPC7161]RXK19192.1 hypothetical protein ER639_02425 [Macrococcus sp. DPC7161]